VYFVFDVAGNAFGKF